MAIAWLNGGLGELGIEVKDEAGRKKGFGLSRLKKEWSEKREDRREEKEAAWGIDAGRAEEGRVIEMLSDKWNRDNDMVCHLSPFFPHNQVPCRTPGTNPVGVQR